MTKVYHTYADVGRFANYLRDNGATDLGFNPDWLVKLEAASRRVDGYCARGQSGFGPRVGTNRYDDPGDSTLWLNDDLLSVGTVTTYDSVGASGVTIGTAEYLLQPYQPTPYRSIRLHENSSSAWGASLTDIQGTWGYSNETLAVGTLALASGSATAGTMTAGTAYAGQTLLVGSEQVYVSATAGSAVGGTVLTLVRGVNGTTAAAGTATASVYVYDSDVVDATLQIAMRRLKGRNAGTTGAYGGGQIPVTMNHDSERAILNGAVHHLRIYGAG